MVTRNDVARLAGVSPTVVSYVINNSNYVSAEKRQAVLDAIKELNYIPNQNATNLRKGRTNMIGIVRGSQLNDMFSSVLLYIEQYASENGFTTATISTVNNMVGRDFFVKDSLVDTLISRHFDALFISNSAFTAAQINRLAANTKVVLFVSRDYQHLDDSVGLIIPDYRKAVRESVEKLFELGHTRISLMPNLSYPINQRDPSNHRFAGYVDAFTAHGMPVDFFYVPQKLDSMEELNNYLNLMFHDPAGHKPPTAICTDEAFLLARLMKMMQNKKLRVPEDVSLICFSSSNLVNLVTPTITSFGFSHHGLARMVIDMIISQINGEEARKEIVTLNYHVGESIAPAPEEK